MKTLIEDVNLLEALPQGQLVLLLNGMPAVRQGKFWSIAGESAGVPSYALPLPVHALQSPLAMIEIGLPDLVHMSVGESVYDKSNDKWTLREDGQWSYMEAVLLFQSENLIKYFGPIYLREVA